MPRMQHPDHGFHNCTDSDVPDMVKNGWSLWAPETVPVEPAPMPEPVIEPEAAEPFDPDPEGDVTEYATRETLTLKKKRYPQ